MSAQISHNLISGLEMLVIKLAIADLVIAAITTIIMLCGGAS